MRGASERSTSLTEQHHVTSTTITIANDDDDATLQNHIAL